MGKFDGILICTDLDDTLLSTDKSVSSENLKAIEYFKSQGGYFTFVTGRVPQGAKLLLDYIHPNAPIVAYNGAGIYDFEKNELIWGLYLDKKALKILDFVTEKIPETGFVICTDTRVCFSRQNYRTDLYRKIEQLAEDNTPHNQITEPIKKVVFVAEEDVITKVRKLIEENDFGEEFDYVQSSANYYEILPAGASKGTGLHKLTQLLDLSPDMTIAVGDNENDISMIKEAKIGIAVGNALDIVKESADIVTVTNDENAIAKIIYDLDSGELMVP